MDTPASMVHLRSMTPRRAAALALLALAGCGGEPAPFALRAVTFNTGTTESLAHDAGPDDGYGAEEAAASDAYYGNGLAWRAAVEHTRAFFASVEADVVGLQEIFASRGCPDVPEAARAGFVCERWREGDPTVAQVIFGGGYQVACHPGKDDKCLAVRTARARIAGCDADLCFDALRGAPVEGCGSGARVAWADLELAEGGTLRVVHVHASSGLSEEDAACRVAQFEQAFAAVEGDTLVLGDFNTDPVRLYGGDPSATALLDGAPQAGLRFVTEVGEDAAPTYAGLLNIDHVLSTFADGPCTSEVVTDMRYFDHRPQVCDLARTE